MHSLKMCDLVSHDRRGHDPVPHRRAPGLLGRVAPGNNITGGKRGSGTTTKGDVWLIDILTQCAWAAALPRPPAAWRGGRARTTARPGGTSFLMRGPAVPDPRNGDAVTGDGTPEATSLEP